MYSSAARGIVKASPSTMQYNENSSISNGSLTLISEHMPAMTSATTVVDLVLTTVSLPPGNRYSCRLELRPADTAVTSSTLGTFFRPPYLSVFRRFCRHTFAVPETRVVTVDKYYHYSLFQLETMKYLYWSPRVQRYFHLVCDIFSYFVPPRINVFQEFITFIIDISRFFFTPTF